MTDSQLREALIAIQIAWERHGEDSKVVLSMKDTAIIHEALSSEWENRGYGLKDGRPL